jgi:hypothetical protein
MARNSGKKVVEREPRKQMENPGADKGEIEIRQ